MKSARFAVAAPLVLALAACGSTGDVPEQDGHNASAPTRKQAEQSAAPAFASVYTDFDLAACEVLDEEREEGSWASYECRGFDDMRLFVQEGDGRFDLDAGADDDGFQTLDAFNDIADTIEWRLREGEPIAVVFRYRDATLEASGRTVLAVETVGTASAPGCRVAHIAGDTPEANRQARELADAASSRNFVCPDRPQRIGEAG